MTDDGGHRGGGEWGMMVPGILRNLEECPEFGVGAREDDTGKIREVLKTDSKGREALNVKTGSSRLTMEVWKRQKRQREVRSNVVTGALETRLGHRESGLAGALGKKRLQGKGEFPSFRVSHRYINKAQEGL